MELTVIRNPTPDKEEVLVTFLNGAGQPVNVLLRKDEVATVNAADDNAVAQLAMQSYVGEGKQVPSFSINVIKSQVPTETPINAQVISPSPEV